MQTTTIKRATAHDAGRLTALIQGSASYRGSYASIISGYRVTADYIARHRVFAAVDAALDVPVDAAADAPTGRRLLGFYALVLDPPAEPELDLIFVADDAQGMGIGRLLVEHMITQARDEGLTGVRVVSHPPAETFYRRLGARRVGTIAPSPPRVTWERPELRFAL